MKKRKTGLFSEFFSSKGTLEKKGINEILRLASKCQQLILSLKNTGNDEKIRGILSILTQFKKTIGKRKAEFFLGFLPSDIVPKEKNLKTLESRGDPNEILSLISKCQRLVLSLKNTGDDEAVYEVLSILAKLKKILLRVFRKRREMFELYWVQMRKENEEFIAKLGAELKRMLLNMFRKHRKILDLRWEQMHKENEEFYQKTYKNQIITPKEQTYKKIDALEKRLEAILSLDELALFNVREELSFLRFNRADTPQAVSKVIFGCLAKVAEDLTEKVNLESQTRKVNESFSDNLKKLVFLRLEIAAFLKAQEQRDLANQLEESLEKQGKFKEDHEPKKMFIENFEEGTDILAIALESQEAQELPTSAPPVPRPIPTPNSSDYARRDMKKVLDAKELWEIAKNLLLGIHRPMASQQANKLFNTLDNLRGSYMKPTPFSFKPKKSGEK